jgi:transposase
MFAELQSHYLFDDRFGRPGKGNDKGKVEGLVGYVRRNFMTPSPQTSAPPAMAKWRIAESPISPYGRAVRFCDLQAVA